MKTKLYLAYGSNLNLGQMGYRCPDSKVRARRNCPITACSSGADHTMPTPPLSGAREAMSPFCCGRWVFGMKPVSICMKGFLVTMAR